MPPSFNPWGQKKGRLRNLQKGKKSRMEPRKVSIFGEKGLSLISYMKRYECLYKVIACSF